MNTIKIDVIGNGYLLTFETGRQEAFPSLDETLARLLVQFEGRGPRFQGDNYGRVVVHRDAPSSSGLSIEDAGTVIRNCTFTNNVMSVDQEIEDLIARRDRARKDQDTCRVLDIEREVKRRGYVLTDTEHGTRWSKAPESVLTKSEIHIPVGELKEVGTIWIGKLLTLMGLAAGSREARRIVEQGGVKIDGERVTDVDADVPVADGMTLTVGNRPAVVLYVERREALA